MPDAPPVTFLANASGSESCRRAVWETVHAAMGPADEALFLDGNYGPAGTYRSGGATRVVRAQDSSLSLGFDRVLSLARTELVVVVGSGCRLGRAPFEHLRAALDTAAAAVLQRRRSPNAEIEDLLHGRVLGIQRSVLQALGGFAGNEERARRTQAGFIGVSELVELTAAEVARGGWTVAHVTLASADALEVGEAATSPTSAPGPEACPTGLDAETATKPPSARRSPELAAALSTAAEPTVRFFSRLLSAEALRAIEEVLPLQAGDAATNPDGGEGTGEWDVLYGAALLRSRGQAPYAAWLLDGVDLRQYESPEEVAEIAAILLGAGRPFETVLERLGHARSQLAAAIVAGDRRKALQLLRRWWQLSPGEPILMSAVLYLAPSMELSEAVAWHRELAGLSSLSPLSQIAGATARTRIERATAVALLELLGTPERAVAADLSPEYLDEGKRRGRELLEKGALARSSA